MRTLRDAILSGGIEPGAELTQVDLASSLGVSRMPVREALIILEYQGLVERLPNQHVRVVRTGRIFFTEVFALAAAIERRVLEQGKPEQAGPDMGEDFEEIAFHRALCQRAESGLPRQTLETVTETYIQYALDCPGYDRSAGLSTLRRAVESGTKADLETYYAGLIDAMMEVREA